MLTGFLIGLGVGMLVTALFALDAGRRHLRRVRAAERRARAAERLAEIGSMTGGLAHEIKNPLSTIGLNVQLLLEGLGDLPVSDQERAPLLNRAKALRRETDRLAGILQDFLQFAGQVVLDARPTDVNEMIGELVDFYTPEAQRQGVRIRAELVAGELWAVVDAKLVKQALLNLMLNATQAMSAGGGEAGGASGRSANSKGTTAGPDGAAAGGGTLRELILRSERLRENGLEYVRVHVIDTGPGMAPEVQARIFQPYFTTKAGGSGLGLPTSRRLIHEHGGRLEVHSEPGKGSDFTVVLPAAGPDHRPGQGTQAAARADPRV